MSLDLQTKWSDITLAILRNEFKSVDEFLEAVRTALKPDGAPSAEYKAGATGKMYTFYSLSDINEVTKGNSNTIQRLLDDLRTIVTLSSLLPQEVKQTMVGMPALVEEPLIWLDDGRTDLLLPEFGQEEKKVPVKEEEEPAPRTKPKANEKRKRKRAASPVASRTRSKRA